MSKKKKKKKSTAQKAPRKSSKKPIIIALCVVAAVAAAIVLSVVLKPAPKAQPEFFDKTYYSEAAYDASGDEVDLRELYNNDRYPNYRGSISLKSDGTFSFWMSVGNPDDGTHKGTYTYDEGTSAVSATFDNGETAEFKVIKTSDGKIDRIEAPYGEYKVYFEESEN